MKMILNEYRLLPFQKEAQELVAKHMEEFFFGEGAALPPGYVPEQAQHGEEALEKVQRDQPDVVLLDLTLPGMDGLQEQAK